MVKDKAWKKKEGQDDQKKKLVALSLFRSRGPVQRLAKGAPVCVPLPRNPFAFEDPTVRQAGTDIKDSVVEHMP